LTAVIAVQTVSKETGSDPMTRELVRVPGRRLRDLKWHLTSETRGSHVATAGSNAGPTPWTRAGRRGS